jgi:pimeloyl-ACP methyl ester carboxylesterase
MLGLFATVLAVAAHPIVGTFYPGDAARTPVVVWGGSGGGQPDAEARALAARGHPAFALTYFGAPGLPAHLESIPLEYFARAVRAFDRRPGVDGRRTVVYGHSRGSESALLVASLWPRLVHGVIATAPANKSYGSAYRRGPGWTLRGRNLPVALADDPLGGFDRAALIEVERIRGPVLLGSGAHDALYDSKAYARAIVRRLRRHRFAYPVRSVVLPGAGHDVGDLMRPVVLRWLAGTARARPRARTGHRARPPARARRRS